MQIAPEFPSKRKRRVFFDEAPDDASPWEQHEEDESEEEVAFKRDVFFVIIDSVVAGLTNRYEAANSIDTLFSFLWQYLQLSEEEVTEAGKEFAETYSCDVSQDQLKDEVIRLKSMHEANFEKKALGPHKLLNKISELNLVEIFENTCVALRSSVLCQLLLHLQSVHSAS